MVGKNETVVEDIGAEDETGEGGGKQRSTIGFPYMNLDDAIEVANAIHNNVGTGECEDDQLAPWLKLSPKSSGYRIRLYTARMFGLVQASSAGRHMLSPLGRRIVDRNQERSARAEAFLRVPLYKAVFEKYKGGVLPPSAAFERDIVGLGVAEKQKGRARQVFERAAEQAGFFAEGKDRLVRPGVAESNAGKSETESKVGEGGGGGGKPPDKPLHPFIQGLLQTLPDPETEWKATDRAKWLQTAANIFDLIYKGDGGIEVRAATAGRSPRPHQD